MALDDVTNVCDGEITKEIKDIIRQMTNACPKDRLSATAVVQKFRSAKGRLRKTGKIKPQTKQGIKRGLVLGEIIPAKFTCTREVNVNSLLKYRPEIVDRGWGWVGGGKDLEVHTIFNLLGRNLFFFSKISFTLR